VSSADKRAVILRATRKGEQLLERARQRRLSRIEALLDSAESADIALLEQALSRVFPGSS
jgi:DNA-binding MarR family transcriptional regulator